MVELGNGGPESSNVVSMYKVTVMYRSDLQRQNTMKL